MTEIVSFGEWLQKRRNQLGLTRKALAQQVGCSPVTIKKIERDERRPSVQLAQLLAYHLQIPDIKQDAFIRRARGEYVPGLDMPAQMAVKPVPQFLPEEKAPESAPIPFVARERELGTLQAALASARAGQGQIRFVIGGAGRGKSMLVQAFAAQAQDHDADLLVVTGYCDAITGIGDPYLPFRQALLMLTADVEARWARGSITQQHARQLWELMPVTLPLLVKHGPDLIDSLLPGKPLLERAATWAVQDSDWFKQLAALTDVKHRARSDQKQLFAQYSAVLKAIAARRPLLVIIEDLHWVDMASSGLLFHLSRELGDSRILLVGTYRPEEVALNRPMSTATGYAERHPMADIAGELKRRHGDIWLDLGESAAAEGRHFVEAYLDTEPNRLGESFREALFRRTGGHALFTVELLQTMQQRGELQQDEHGRWVEGQAIDWSVLPARVEGVIEKRIERLAEDLQAILTIAGIEGETFTAEVVARVRQVDAHALVRQLSRELDKQHRLVSAQAIEWLDPGRRRLSVYRFRHHLFQDYLYRRLDVVERIHLHEAVGRALEQHYADHAGDVAVRLAWHFQEAGFASKAVDYLIMAGDQAARGYAYREAITHFNNALSHLKPLPETAENARRELSLQIALGNALIVTEGFAAPQVEKAFARAWELCRRLDESPQQFAVLFGLWTYYTTRTEHERAWGLGEQLLHLARKIQDEHFILQAHHSLWTSHFVIGEFVAARENFEQGLALYDPQRHHAQAFRYGGHDPGVCGASFAGPILFCLGYPDQALQKGHEALALARELSHPVSLTTTLRWRAAIHQLRREEHAVQKWADEAIALATRHGFPMFVGWATTMRGWALAQQGREEEGIAQIRQGLDTYRATGAALDRPYMMALLAEALLKNGQIEEGIHTVREALTIVQETGERYFESELTRLHGALLLAGGEPVAVVEAHFQEAIDISRRQEARSLQLRAAMSLARLWQSQGEQEEAYQLLDGIYGWFTEGFDTTDLKEVASLLREWSSS